VPARGQTLWCLTGGGVGAKQSKAATASACALAVLLTAVLLLKLELTCCLTCPGCLQDLYWLESTADAAATTNVWMNKNITLHNMNTLIKKYYFT
jgi:hypothetical protein